MRFLFGGVILLVFSCSSVAETIDRNELDQSAVNDGFGYKYANLQQLLKLIGNKFGSYEISIPEFVGISNSSIQKYLENEIDLVGEWSKIIDRHFATATQQDELFAKSTFSFAFLHETKALQKQIKNAFAEKIAHPTGIFLKLDDAFASSGLDRFIRHIHEKNNRLMVRSTGKEDTSVLTNAGGNRSVSHVEPQNASILHAIKKVVVSYFDEKSLRQRLVARDRSLFEKEPFTPILLQRMVGEEGAKSITKCGVMFTEEAEGGISRYGNLGNLDNNGIQTTGITLIQAAYGRNDGVNGIIPVDSYYIDKSQRIYPIIRQKKQRMVPANKSGELRFEKNAFEVVTQSSLNRDVLITLKKFANSLEEFYQGPMDVEFVVSEKEHTIFIVQARPIVHSRRLPNPSYVKNLATAKKFDHFIGSSIGVAGGAIRICNKSETVLARDIGQALVKYRAHSNPKDVKCIIVGQSAPATSHEATNFRFEAKPVLSIENWQQVERWFERSGARILLSPQQHLVVNWNGDDKVLQEISAPGWTSYPAIPYLSLMEQFAPTDSLTDTAIMGIYPVLENSAQWQTFQANAIKVNLDTLFAQLLHADEMRAQLALASILFKVKYALEEESAGGMFDESRQQRVNIIQSYVLQCAKDINANRSHRPGDRDFSKRLLPVHFLRALLFQRPSFSEIVQGESLLSLVAQKLSVERDFTKKLQAKNIVLNDAISLQFLKVGKAALNNELENRWFNFVLALDEKGDTQLNESIAKLLVHLGKMEMLPLWLHTSFNRNQDVQTLINEFEEDSSFFVELTKKRTLVEDVNIAGFANARSFEALWKNFDNELLQYVVGDGFADAFSRAGSLGKLAALAFMGTLVDKFDLSIKELQASAQFDEQTQLENFQCMLKGYFALLEKWTALKTQEVQDLALRMQSLSGVINKKVLIRADLSFSRFFDVGSFCIGSGAKFVAASKPETLEDAFSVIHQNFVMLFSALSLQAGAGDISLPLPLSKAALVLNLGLLVGIELKNNEISLHSNKTLRFHGVQYALRYRHSSNKILLESRFSGRNLANRWDNMVHFVVALKLFGKYDVKNITFSDFGVSFSVVLDEHDDLEALGKILRDLEGASDKMGGLDIRIARRVDNVVKSLEIPKTNMEFLSAFEREIGLASMCKGDFQEYIEGAIIDDADFVKKMLNRVLELDHVPSALNGLKPLPCFLEEMIIGLNSAEAFKLAFESAMKEIRTPAQYGLNTAAYNEAVKSGFAMFTLLINQGAKEQYDNIARAVAWFILQDVSDENVYNCVLPNHKNEALDVFELLLKKDITYKKIAIETLSQASDSNKKWVQQAGIKLLQILTHYSQNKLQNVLEPPSIFRQLRTSRTGYAIPQQKNITQLPGEEG